MANAADGTVVGGGDVISDEAVPLNVARGDALVPAMGSAYKLPRSKLVTGAYGRDDGDVGPMNALPVVSRAELQMAERLYFAQIEETGRQMQANQIGNDRYRSIFERGYSERGGR